MATYRIIAPYTVYLPRKTVPDVKVRLNMNNSQLKNKHVYNQAKKIFKQIMEPELQEIKLKPPVNIMYKVFKPSARRLDGSNVVDIVKKFFCDALVECGCMEDDSDDYILQEVRLETEMDRQHPRVEIIIVEVGANNATEENNGN